MKNRWLYILCLLVFIFSLFSCKRFLWGDDPGGVGIGNTAVAFILFAIITALVVVIGLLLNLIPVVGRILFGIIKIGIILLWIFIVIVCIISYGLIQSIIGIIIGIAISCGIIGSSGGIKGIFIFWE